MRLIPTLLQFPLHLIPDDVHAFFLSRCCNHLLKGQGLAQRLREIDGKSLCISIEDAGCRFFFDIRAGRLHALYSPAAVDVTISGNSDAFWKLATEQEDADTLFFRRSLCVEGETETGVHIKNLLDSLEYDWDSHFETAFPAPLAAVMKRVRNKVTCIKQRYQYTN